MIRMRAPFTGFDVEVSEESAARWIERGYIPEDGWEPPAEVEEEPEDSEAEDLIEPDAESTIAEIRQWAAAHGVELPAKATKAELLAALGLE